MSSDLVWEMPVEERRSGAVALERESSFYRRGLANVLSIILSDAVVMFAALCLSNVMLLLINDIPFSIRNGFLIIPAWALVSCMGRFTPGWGLGVVEELRRIQVSLFILFGLVLAVSFFTRKPLASSRIVFLFTYLVAAVFLPINRALVRSMLAKFRMWGIPISLYGDLGSIEKMILAIQAEPGLGYIPAAIFTNDEHRVSVVHGVSVRGNLSQTTLKTPVAMVAMPDASRHQLIETLDGPLEVYRRIIIIPDLSEAPSLWVVPRDIQGILGLEITKNLLNPMARMIKRAFDLALVLCTMPLWLPITAFLYGLIWLEDRENPLFLQPRLGRHGRIFKTFKFRTMVPNAEQVLQEALEKDPDLRAEWETYFKLRRDPRITRVGALLRKTSLDEIPQLFNVLMGSMSVVGPRPLPPYHHQELSENVRFLRDRVRPGITGLWQVSGRSESGNEGMEKWDPYYVRNWSVWLDLVIFFRTFKAVFKCHGAY